MTTVEDVAVSLGRPIVGHVEVDQVSWWIRAAEVQIRARLGDLSLLDQEVLNYVVVEAVAAKAQNPEGALSETVDDYTYRLPSESRRVTILDEWWSLLDSGSSSGAFSIRPGFEPDEAAALGGWA